MPLLIDAHQDLAYNIMTFGRDYTLSANEIRKNEQGTFIPGVAGDSLLGWQDYQKGDVGIIFGTLFACPGDHQIGPWDQSVYNSPMEANRVYRSQLDIYHRLTDENPDKFRLIQSIKDLDGCLESWKKPVPSDQPKNLPVGLVILMEGAEGVMHPDDLVGWWQLGVRMIGPAWTGTRFCGGTGAPGPLTKDGWELLEAMAEIGFVLDISHMSETSSLQALDAYQGRIIASHANARVLLKNTKNDRHLTDLQIQRVIERQGVIGIIPTNPFLISGWKKSDPREAVTLSHICAQIDHICQIAGNDLHVGFGTDFDGGFGLQSVPGEIETIADIQKVAAVLSSMGYTEVEIENIFSGNWSNLLKGILPT